MALNIIPFNDLISARKKGNQSVRALEVLEAMQRQSTLPNNVTYSTLVSACVKGMRPGQARSTRS